MATKGPSKCHCSALQSWEGQDRNYDLLFVDLYGKSTGSAVHRWIPQKLMFPKYPAKERTSYIVPKLYSELSFY